MLFANLDRCWKVGGRLEGEAELMMQKEIVGKHVKGLHQPLEGGIEITIVIHCRAGAFQCLLQHRVFFLLQAVEMAGHLLEVAQAAVALDGVQLDILVVGILVTKHGQVSERFGVFLDKHEVTGLLKPHIEIARM